MTHRDPRAAVAVGTAAHRRSPPTPAGVRRRRNAGPDRGGWHITLVDVRGAVGRLFLIREDVVSHDAFHPSDAGYGLIADALLPALVAGLPCAHSDIALEGVS